MDPLTWAWLALMVASTGANYAAQRKVSNETAKVNADARRRRDENQRKSEALTMNSADLYTNTPAKEDARAAELAQQYAKAAPAPTEGPHGTSFLANTAPTQSTATIEETQKQLDKANANVARRGAADAKLRAFGDVMGENAILAGRNSQDIGQGASFVNSWQQNVMPLALQAAAESGNSWKNAADVMKLAATVMGPWALSNGPGGGADTEKGVLEQMGGTPKEFAGRDLFHMNKMFGPGQSFSSPATVGEVMPTAGMIDNGIESTALGNLGLGSGLVMDPRQQRLLMKQMLGQPLTEWDRYLLSKF